MLFSFDCITYIIIGFWSWFIFIVLVPDFDNSNNNEFDMIEQLYVTIG